MVVEAFIEIPKYSHNKYEYDLERGVFRLDRPLYSPVHYPGDYGFIPNTLAEDDDPLDILVITDNPTFPGCIVQARVVGALVMSDEKGQDTKILSVVDNDPRTREIFNLEDVPQHIRREIEYFFAIYKELEGKPTAVSGWRDRKFAEEEIIKSREAFSRLKAADAHKRQP